MTALDNNPDDPDDLSYNFPTKPSLLVALSDDDMFRLLRKVAYANNWGFDSKVQFEATGRLIAALRDFKRSSDKAAARILALTIALVALTVALVAMTGVLVWLTTEL